MARGRAAGAAIAVVGLLVVIAGVALSFVGANQSTAAGQVYSFTPDALGPALLTVTWSGVPASSNVTLASGPPASPEFRYLCQSQPNEVASGSGSSGTLRATVTGGSEYSVYVCNGIFGVVATIGSSVVGLTPVVAVGFALAVAGGALAAIYRTR